jgi:hypothetical protein
VDEIRAESWLHLHELLFSESWHESLVRHRSDFVFRGEASTGSSLDARHAGNSPKITPVKSDSPKPRASDQPSM